MLNWLGARRYGEILSLAIQRSSRVSSIRHYSELVSFSRPYGEIKVTYKYSMVQKFYSGITVMASKTIYKLYAFELVHAGWTSVTIFF